MNKKVNQALELFTRYLKNKYIIGSVSLICLFFLSMMAGAIYSRHMGKTVPTAAISVEDAKKHNKEDELLFAKNMAVNETMLVKKAEREAKKIAAEEARRNAQNKPQGSNMDPLYVPDGTKVAYLTFDDGPTRNVTPRILETLKQYDVKATFFIIGSMAQESPDLILREHNEGHLVANHTYTHDYKLIYQNTQSLLDDFNRCENLLKTLISGYSSKIVRFPGGSYGGKLEPFRRAVTEAGYRYVDWNALNSDADANMIPKGSYSLPADRLLQNLKESVGTKQHVVILMHDAGAKGTTADSLPQVIEYLKSQGYIFKTLE